MPLPEGMTDEAQKVAAITCLMATWWITEAIPIPATALLPIALFPLLGVLETSKVTAAYGNHLIFLFMGGFLIAVTMEKWNLHKRIALHTIRMVGVTPNRIILGFMLATAFLSMWISNTATAMMMVTIGLAILKQVRDQLPSEREQVAYKSFALALMLCIAYSASIGGVATLIGTPPNAILAGVIEKNHGIHISFGQWMAFGLPLSITMLAIAWFYITRFILGNELRELPGGRTEILKQIELLGPIQKEEKRILLVFSLVALAWIARGFIKVDALSMVTDSSIAIMGALALFIIPSNLHKREFLLDWHTAVKIPWDIIILFGGGFALASGFQSCGLTEWIANQVNILQDSNTLILVAFIALIVIFLTEVTSNTATAALLLPVMGALAISINIHPLVTMVTTAIAASFAFMLPVATPPNAIVFSSHAVTIPQMAKAGLVLNLIGIIVITCFVMIVLPLAGFDIGHF